MRKGYVVTLVVLAIAVVVWGPKFNGKTNSQPSDSGVIKSVPTTVGKQEPNQEADSSQVEENNQNPTQVDIPKVDSSQKEIVVEGTVKKVSYSDRIITFEQELDDNSVKIDPNVAVKNDALIKTTEGKVSLEVLKPGDYVTMVINAKGEARAVQIN